MISNPGAILPSCVLIYSLLPFLSPIVVRSITKFQWEILVLLFHEWATALFVHLNVVFQLDIDHDRLLPNFQHMALFSLADVNYLLICWSLLHIKKWHSVPCGFSHRSSLLSHAATSHRLHPHNSSTVPSVTGVIVQIGVEHIGPKKHFQCFPDSLTPSTMFGIPLFTFPDR